MNWQSSAGADEVVHALSLALTGTHCGVTVQDRDLGYRYIFNLPSCWTVSTESEPDDGRIFGVHLGEKLSLAKAAIMVTGERQKLTTMAQGRVISFSIERWEHPGRAMMIVSTIQDVTYARKREATLRTLLLELSHRSKNLLAIIQGIANQSAKHSHTLDGFLKAFTGRLHAVSGSQDVLVDSNWQGASLFELARRQLVLADADSETAVTFAGEDIELDPNQSLHIGLALHELAMIAATPADGDTGPKDVSLRAEKIMISGTEHVQLVWHSTGMQPDIAKHPDFGSVLLEKVVPAAVFGKVEKRQSDNAIEWTLTFPLRLAPTKRTRKKTYPVT